MYAHSRYKQEKDDTDLLQKASFNEEMEFRRDVKKPSRIFFGEEKYDGTLQSPQQSINPGSNQSITISIPKKKVHGSASGSALSISNSKLPIPKISLGKTKLSQANYTMRNASRNVFIFKGSRKYKKISDSMRNQSPPILFMNDVKEHGKELQQTSLTKVLLHIYDGQNKDKAGNGQPTLQAAVPKFNDLADDF